MGLLSSMRRTWAVVCCSFTVGLATACSDPQYDVTAYVTLENENETLSFEGGEVRTWPDNVYVVDATLSASDARNDGLAVKVNDGTGEIRIEIELEVCLHFCDPECANPIGQIVQESLGVIIERDHSLLYSGSTCQDADGRQVTVVF